MTDATRQNELETFRSLLDAYGADRARWPAGAARRWESLLRSDSEARRLLAEAAAFDRLLDQAATEADESPASRALADRILASAAARPLLRPSPLPGNVTVLAPRRAPPPPRFARRTEWRAAALLAASLLCGLYIGQQGLGDDLLSSASETVGFAASTDTAALGLPLTGTTALEEDAL